MQNLKAQARRVDKMHFARNACQRLVARQRKGTSAIRVQKTILRARDAPSRSPILRATLNIASFHRRFPPLCREDDTTKRTKILCAQKHDATRPVQRRAVATGAYFYRARARRERERTSFYSIAHHVCTFRCSLSGFWRKNEDEHLPKGRAFLSRVFSLGFYL